jgi:hypothetical protein
LDSVVCYLYVRTNKLVLSTKKRLVSKNPGGGLAGGMSDAIPAWAGGLPADAPPRLGTAKYDEFMKERERKRLMPASEQGEETKSTPSSQDAIH